MLPVCAHTLDIGYLLLPAIPQAQSIKYDYRLTNEQSTTDRYRYEYEQYLYWQAYLLVGIMLLENQLLVSVQQSTGKPAKRTKGSAQISEATEIWVEVARYCIIHIQSNYCHTCMCN